jgi:glucosamine--fructose-6-phosphate aminotransferase (isomerizing)
MTIMEKEARQVPDLITKQMKENLEVLTSLAQRLRKDPPSFAMTVARGSSDHAATYAKYLLETKLGIVTSSAAPSVLTIYGTHLYEKGGLIIGISQSGASPDICEMMQEARKKGTLTVAIVNHVDSPMAQAAEYVVPLHAGEEVAVAATKSYLASLSALLQLITICTQDEELAGCLQRLPDALRTALTMDWDTAIPLLKDVADTLVIARGYGFPVAQEAALKFKETSAIHAEAFSGAEVLHGPFGLVRKDYPILLFPQNDASLEGMLDLAKKIRSLGAVTLMSAPGGLLSPSQLAETTSVALPLPESLNPLCDPLMAIQAFYVMVARLAVKRGYDPDSPDNLKKVTKTM